MARGHIVRPVVATYLAMRAGDVAGLERALAWDPKNPDLHLRLARALCAGGRSSAGPASFDTALRLRPADAMAWLHLALYRDRRGDRPGSSAALEWAIWIDQHNVAVRWEAALLSLRWGHRERALEHLRYVLAVDAAQREAAFQLARCCWAPATMRLACCLRAPGAHRRAG